MSIVVSKMLHQDVVQEDYRKVVGGFTKMLFFGREQEVEVGGVLQRMKPPGGDFFK